MKDANGYTLYSRFPVYARIDGRARPVRLCTFDTFQDAMEYMRGLG